MENKENMLTVGFSLENEFGEKYSQSSTFEVFHDLGENDLDELGRHFNYFLQQCGYSRQNEYLFMRDITGEEYEALEDYLNELREDAKK